MIPNSLSVIWNERDHNGLVVIVTDSEYHTGPRKTAKNAVEVAKNALLSTFIYYTTLSHYTT